MKFIATIPLLFAGVAMATQLKLKSSVHAEAESQTSVALPTLFGLTKYNKCCVGGGNILYSSAAQNNFDDTDYSICYDNNWNGNYWEPGFWPHNLDPVAAGPAGIGAFDESDRGTTSLPFVGCGGLTSLKWYGVQIKTPNHANYGVGDFYIECYHDGAWTKIVSQASSTTTFHHDSAPADGTGVDKNHQFNNP